MLDFVADEIIRNPKFIEDLEALRRAHAQRLCGEVGSISQDVFVRLAQTCAVFSASQNEHRLNIAYEIAAKLLHIDGFSESSRKLLFRTTLQRLQNFPAEKYFSYEGGEYRGPVSINVEVESVRADNTVAILGEPYELTGYQRKLWGALTARQSVSTSAPTSAGKSFIVSQYVMELARTLETDESIVYIVPSKALISQVSKHLRARLSGTDADVDVITVAPAPGDHPPSKAIFVFTQERLHTAYKAGAIKDLRLLVVDESQEIGSSGRGVLLGSVVERSILAFPRAQVLFAGPNIKNPEIFQRLFAKPLVVVSTVQRTVSQSMYFIDRADSETEGKLLIQGADERTSVGTIKFSRPMRTEDDRLVSMACWLRGQGQTLVYVGGPGKAEKVSLGIAEEMPQKDDEELLRLSELAKAAVHKNYSLASDVLKGVGYHYGRMPTILREAIEQAFADGLLDYIVCTSTLLQGVNLPARNLVMYDPVKGKKKEPINGVEFWNLAGRAGRLGKEFEGNVFLVDYEKWKSKPLVEDGLQEIDSSYESQIKENQGQLIEIFANSQESTMYEDNIFETASARLFADFMNGKLEQVMRRAGLAPSTEEYRVYHDALMRLSAANRLPLSVLSDSPSVPIARQNSLYRRLQNSLKKKGPDYIIPKHPMDTDAYQSHQMMYQRCYKEILGAKNFGKVATRTTALSLLWAKGAPIPALVDKAYEYAKENARWSTVIRETLSDVENLLRFQCVKMTSCYTSVLRHLLEEAGHEDQIARIPAISAFLEVGASSSTMLSLMSLGLSRFSASQIQATGVPQNLGRADAVRFLRDRALQLDIPPRSLSEIQQILN